MLVLPDAAQLEGSDRHWNCFHGEDDINDKDENNSDNNNNDNNIADDDVPATVRVFGRIGRGSFRRIHHHTCNFN